MSNQEETNQIQVEQSFAKVLNRHGYGFQFSVLKKIRDLFNSGESSWLFEVIEFPVEVQGTGTRIDFVLQHYQHVNRPFYLLAECKRANPSLSNWCFIRAPYVHRNRTEFYEPIIMEHLERRNDGSVLAYAEERSGSHNPYHIGLEVRANIKGDEKGESGKAIEDAASQISRGLNGYIEMLSKNPQIMGEQTRADFLPVIFTTAQLWGSEADLSSAELETGIVDLKGVEFKKLQWLCYQYHLSPGLKHSASPAERPPVIGAFMQSEYVRTIPIVSPSGIESFLRWSSKIDLYD